MRKKLPRDVFTNPIKHLRWRFCAEIVNGLIALIVNSPQLLPHKSSIADIYLGSKHTFVISNESSQRCL